LYAASYCNRYCNQSLKGAGKAVLRGG
jgi:hypothetical protein